MYWQYGTAVIKEMLEPPASRDELRRLAVMEYGPSTGSAFVLGQATSVRDNGVRHGTGRGMASLARRLALIRKVAQPRMPPATTGADE